MTCVPSSPRRWRDSTSHSHSRDPHIMSTLTADLKKSLRHPEFWWYSTWLDILTDYRRMRLGLVWALVPPIFYCVGLGYVYSIFMGRGMSTLTYMAHLGVGWSLWRMTTNVLSESAKIFTSHKAFILDGHVRFFDYVMRVMARSLFNFAFAFAVTLVVLFVDGGIHWYNMLTLFVTLPIYVYNLIWIGVVVALLGARFPDIRELISTILLFGFFLTPILWPASAMPADTMRGLLARFNPAFHFVEMVWAPIAGGQIETASYAVIAGMTIGGSILAAYLYRRYARFVPLWI